MGSCRVKVAPISTREVDALDFVMEPGPCAYSVRNRCSIDAFFADRQQARPSLWNGQVLMLSSWEFQAVEGRTRLKGRFVETDYATLLWLLHRGDADPELRNAFAMAALRGADGGFVLTRQADWTYNAGRIYFAAGTPEPSDIAPDGRVDLQAGMLRELREETGLPGARFTPGARWLALFDDRHLALIREFVAPETASALAGRIRAFVAEESKPEIDDVLIAHHPADLQAGMPDFIRHYLLTVWGQPENAA